MATYQQQFRDYLFPEDAMELLLIIVVLFMVFGGGFYGYRRWR